MTMDSEQRGVDVRADLRRLPFDGAHFDISYCSNVLAYIPDDAAAMRELVRVLAPGGTAIVQVPLTGDTTDEDASVTAPAVRAERFGQADHVRQYGRDFKERLTAA